MVLKLEQQHYLTKQMGYEFEIIYRPRRLNKVVSALSRQWGEWENLGEESRAQLKSLTIVESNLLEALTKINARLPEIQNLHQAFIDGKLDAHYKAKDGILCF